MSIQRVVGGLRPSLEVSWQRDDGTPEPLTGATMTGTIEDRQGNSRAIAGELSVLDGAAGTFEWAFDAADLAAPGTYQVQFVAAFNTAPTPAKSFDVELTVV
jgi:hypothetical protein